MGRNKKFKWTISTDGIKYTRQNIVGVIERKLRENINELGQNEASVQKIRKHFHLKDDDPTETTIRSLIRRQKAKMLHQENDAPAANQPQLVADNVSMQQLAELSAQISNLRTEMVNVLADSQTKVEAAVNAERARADGMSKEIERLRAEFTKITEERDRHMDEPVNSERSRDSDDTADQPNSEGDTSSSPSERSPRPGAMSASTVARRARLQCTLRSSSKRGTVDRFPK